MRRIAAALALTIAAGCAVPRRPDGAAARRDLPEIRQNFAERLIAKRRVDGLRLTVFDTGVAVVSGDSVSSMKSRDARVKLPALAFLIEHPVEGRILFDTGLSPDGLGGLFTMRPGQDLVSQLRARGADPGGVKFVIVSHLHYDHAGMLAAFPQARWLVDAREWRAVQAVAGVDPAFIDASRLPRSPELVDLSTAPSFGPFDHGLDLFGDGTIMVLDLSGHTPGNLGLWVNLNAGPALLAGGASSVVDNDQDLALPRAMAEPTLYLRRLLQIQAARAAVPQLVVLPGHDLTPLSVSPRADIALPR